MDNITHGVLGILLGVAVAAPALRRRAALAALIAAELPDLDVFISSAEDPLYGLQMHRHFTHSLIMVPVLAALGLGITAGLYALRRRAFSTAGLWLPVLLAAFSHAICDMWTSYGTHWLWPFSEKREAWDLISVIDPLLTLPLLVLALSAWRKASRVLALAGCAWCACYLTLCTVQHSRAMTALGAAAADAGHQPGRMTVKPSFANIMVWRGLYEWEGSVHILCIRPGITEGTVLKERVVVPQPSLAELRALAPSELQAGDVERFFHFSDGWVALHPSVPGLVGDLRYSALPGAREPLWGIELLPNAPQLHTPLRYYTPGLEADWGALWRLITGAAAS
jgi:inner membrane protein